MAWITVQRYLNQREMEQNALEIWAWWRSKGWSMESCAAILGNMQQESTINPALYEQGWGAFTGVETWTHGFGLIQWTPCNQYYSRFNAVGLSIMYPNDQLAWLDYECQAGRGYYFKNPNYDYRYWGWSSLVYESDPNAIDDMTVCFMWSRERPAYDAAGIANRKAYARAWYQFLGGYIGKRPPIWLLFKLKERNSER